MKKRHPRPIPSSLLPPPKLGPAGRYPDGQIHPTDSGELRLAVTHHRGRVVVDFGSPVHWIAMEPEQVYELIESLKAHAEQCGRPVRLEAVS